MHAISFVALLCVVLIITVNSETAMHVMTPSSAGMQVSVMPSQSVTIQVDALAPDTSYELRVNYRASVRCALQFSNSSMFGRLLNRFHGPARAQFPADFTVKWQSPGEESHATRTLLDTERLGFRTDARGHVIGLSAHSGPPIAIIHATYSGVSYLPDAAQRPIPVLVVLEKLVLGVPTSLAWLVAFTFVILVLTLSLLAPYMARVMRGLGKDGPPKAS